MATLPGAKWNPDFKPLWSKPPASRMVKSWPPADPLKAVKADGNDFWNLARAHGRDNPWDIIIYNFGTEEPREVNWYLHHAVGCWQSHDGKNFSCDYAQLADGSDGQLYIPKPGWRPPASFRKGSGGGGYVAALVDAVWSILMNVARRIPQIHHGNTTVNGRFVEQVAELINTREIAVQVDPTLYAEAQYYEKVITLRKMPSINHIGMHGTLANEATHAITHMRSLTEDLYDNEICSSLVQSIAEASLSEKRILRLMQDTWSGYDRLYFPGWVWLNHFAGAASISLNHMNRMYRHPVHGKEMNPVAEFHAYHMAIDSYRTKRGRVWGFDWDI